MSASRRLLSCLTVIAALAAACGSSDDTPSCARLAEHEARLVLTALPAAMQERAHDSMAGEREKIFAACKREQPSSAQARCELAATDLAAHRRCELAAAQGVAR